MRLITSLLVSVIFLLSGCSFNSLPHNNKLEDAIVEADIDNANILDTIERDHTAFSIYQSDDQYGVIHFEENKKDGWRYNGHSGFSKITEANPPAFDYGLTTILNDDLSEMESSEQTVLLGEIYDTAITDILLTIDGKQTKATILNSDLDAIWYLESNVPKKDSDIIISGYDLNNNLILEESFQMK